MNIDGDISNAAVQAEINPNGVYSVNSASTIQQVTGYVTQQGSVTAELSSEGIDGELSSSVAKVDTGDYIDYLTVKQLLEGKVDKVDGKELSTNDFTDEDKAKLDAYSSPTQPVQSDWNEDDTASLAYILNKPEILTKSELDTTIATSLKNYATKDYVSSSLSSYIKSADVKSLLNGYATEDYVSTALIDYSTKDYVSSLLSEYSTKQYVDSAIGNAVENLSTLQLSFVDTLPSVDDGQENIIYIILGSDTQKGKSYIFNSNLYWEIGNAEADIDLSDYYTKNEADALLADKADADHSHNGEYLSSNGGTVTGTITILTEDEKLVISGWAIQGNGNATLNGFSRISTDALEASYLTIETFTADTVSATEIYEDDQKLSDKYALKSEINSSSVEVDLSDYYTKSEIDEQLGDIASVLATVVAGCDIEAVLSTVVEGYDEDGEGEDMNDE
jgi:hypothetical protein